MKKHNLIKYILLITIATVLFAPAAYSQFHVGIDYRYCLGIREQMIGRELYIAEYDMHNYYLQLTATYQITPQIATGIGISAGMAEYHKLYTFPLFATCVSAPSKAGGPHSRLPAAAPHTSRNNRDVPQAPQSLLPKAKTRDKGFPYTHRI